jgi:hypothetical protein
MVCTNNVKMIPENKFTCKNVKVERIRHNFTVN